MNGLAFILAEAIDLLSEAEIAVAAAGIACFLFIRILAFVREARKS